MSADLDPVPRPPGLPAWLASLLTVLACAAFLGLIMLPLRVSRTKGPCGGGSLDTIKNLATACMAYADDDPLGRYPWAVSATGTLTTQAEVRACLRLLYVLDYVDDPKAFFCRGAPDDAPTDHVPNVADRKTRFRLEDGNCSFTYRRVPTTRANSSGTPLVACRADNRLHAGHPAGWYVAYVGSRIEFFTREEIEDPKNAKARAVREALLGFETLPPPDVLR